MAMATPCPVCSTGVYLVASAPMAKMGTTNPAQHSCVDNRTWKDKVRFGGNTERLRAMLMTVGENQLAAGPRVLELKRKAEAGESL